jgi:hypothetical protein
MGFAEMAVSNPVADIAARLLGIEPRKA